MSSENIVHVIDDDDAVRDSLSFLLKTASHSVRVYDSAVAFLDGLPVEGTGCIVTDIRMPAVDGIELLRRLKQKAVSLPVIVITGHGDVPLAVEAMKLGAVDFLEKPFDEESLLNAVRFALDRRTDRTTSEARKAEMHEKLSVLTPRERQVLDGLVAGQPNKVIAFELGISPRTVEVYRANVMTKLQAKSLSELIRIALAVAS